MLRLVRRASASLAIGLCAVSIASCNSDKRSSPVLQGTIVVTVTSRDGLTPSIQVTGPNAYSKTFASSQTLTALPIGDYNVAADSLAAPDSVVGTFVDTAHITNNPVSLASRDTVKVAVTYARERTTGGLWIMNNETDTIPEFAPAQLRAGQDSTPAEMLTTAVSGPSGAALDSSDNLWVSSYASDSLVMYSLAARSSGGAPVPSVAIVDTTLQFAQGIAMDRHGNLWVAANGEGEVLEYTASQLAAGGGQTPTVVLTLTNAGLPWSVAFDSAGDLWVADNANNRLVAYTPSQLAATGSPTPADTIGSNSSSIDDPSGIVFDPKGNLWLANGSGSTVVEYTPSQLTAGGSPAPAVTITLPANAVPAGVALDRSGTLWVADADPNGASIFGLRASQLAASGSPTPAVVIHGYAGAGSFSPEQLVFDPLATAPAPSTSRVRPPHSAAAHAGRVRMNPNLARLLHRTR